MIQRWNNEDIKAKLYFDNGRTYSVNMNTSSDSGIVSVIKNETEQVNYNNIFGSISSNEILLTIFDVEDKLNIENKKSPFYNYMRHGVKIELSIDYNVDDKYEKYGTYYVTDWSGILSDGFHDVVKIQAVDEMQYILNADIPKLGAYAGIRADQLIIKVLSGIGINSSRIKIHKSLNTSLMFGVAEDSKVGYFLNEICQALCAVIVINDNNDILIMPALTGYNKEYTLSDDFIISVNNQNNNKNIYTRVKCRYNKKKGEDYGTILYDVQDLSIGNNIIYNSQLSRNAVSITEIRTEIDSDYTDIEAVNFSAYQKGIDFTLNSKSKTDDAKITVYGKYTLSSEKHAISNLLYNDISRDVTYEMFNDYIQTEEDAKNISDLMARYIELNNHRIVINTIFTPRITVGDIINFDNVFLRGKYKVIASRTQHGTSYNKELTLIPYDLHGVWDDSKEWDDNTSWIENLTLSLA